MIEPLGTLTRTHTCGELRAADIGREVTLLGWVHRVRDLGSLVFIDVRDRYGVTQVVVQEGQPFLDAAKHLRAEFVVGVTGLVRARGGEVNSRLATGEVEVAATALRVLNEAAVPPFQIADEATAAEELRLRYRYLDLRRPALQANLGLRHRVTMAIRRYFDAEGFWEIETPVLGKSTPEGARDYLVPSRVHHGEFYALPQSPQLFKQLLMVAGTDRYFQIVKCFRDEDLRADRQPEFTQVDVEMSFARPDLVFGLIEPLMRDVFAVIGRDIESPFRRMPYADAIARYGSDKPDLRVGLRDPDLSPVFADSTVPAVPRGARRRAGVFGASSCRAARSTAASSWTAWRSRRSSWAPRRLCGRARRRTGSRARPSRAPVRRRCGRRSSGAGAAGRTSC